MTKTISIEGMSCSHCSAHVKQALSVLSGVEDVVVSLEAKNALVTMDAEVSDAELTKAVTDAGYTVTNVR